MRKFVNDTLRFPEKCIEGGMRLPPVDKLCDFRLNRYKLLLFKPNLNQFNSEEKIFCSAKETRLHILQWKTCDVFM